MNSRSRPSINLDEDDAVDDGLDLSSFEAPSRRRADRPSHDTVAKVTTGAGFKSRQAGFDEKPETSENSPRRSRRRRRISPYTDQVNIKVRPAVKDVFHILGERHNCYDAQTFEKAIGAFVRELGDSDIQRLFDQAVSEPKA